MWEVKKINENDIIQIVVALITLATAIVELTTTIIKNRKEDE